MFERLSKLGPREKAGVVLALLFLLALVGDRLVVRPVVTYTLELDGALQQEQARLRYNRRVMKTEGPVREAYRRAVALVQPVSGEDEDLGDLKRRINELARESGLNILATKDREVRGGGACVVYAVDIGKYSGNMTSLLTFADLVYRAPGMLRITHLQIAPESGTERVTGAMTITKMMLDSGDAQAPKPDAEG